METSSLPWLFSVSSSEDCFKVFLYSWCSNNEAIDARTCLCHSATSILAGTADGWFAARLLKPGSAVKPTWRCSAGAVGRSGPDAPRWSGSFSILSLSWRGLGDDAGSCNKQSTNQTRMDMPVSGQSEIKLCADKSRSGPAREPAYITRSHSVFRPRICH